MSAATAQSPTLSRPDAAAILSCSGVARTFRMAESRIQVLRSVDLSLKAGEFLAIEGRSGSGKSTLLHILGALDQADAGQVLFEGRDIARLGAAERSRLRNTQFGFVFQFYHLLPELNVLENTLLSTMIQYNMGQFRAKKADLAQLAKE